MYSKTPLITDVQAALDLLVTICHQFNVTKLVINKESISEDFFRLSTGLAGEVAQKFVNYSFRVAIVGDFSLYTSKPLHDYMYESNRGRQINFVETETDAIKRLGGAV